MSLSFEEISIRTNKTREIAAEVKTQSIDTPYDRGKIQDCISKNGGNAYNEMFDVNSKTDMCANVTRQMMECTARFLENVANNFESSDYAMASEVTKA